jgi:hypothetical protein
MTRQTPNGNGDREVDPAKEAKKITRKGKKDGGVTPY